VSSVWTLTSDEAALIRGMLAHRPQLSNQQILAYFSRPGRDINHRVIGDFRGGWAPAGVGVASRAEVDHFMSAIEAMWAMAPLFMQRSWLGGSRSLFLDWWPVGQGLFASGAIAGGLGPPLNWVYDCGTSSSDNLLVKALDSMRAQQLALGASRIRLCAISHFDKDHISGLIRLLARFPVQTLLLPYIPVWRRLMVAIDLGIAADDPFLDFFIDPVTWLRERAEGRIGEILFVPASGPDDAPGAADDDDRSPGGGELDDHVTDLKAEVGDTPDEATGDPALSATQAGLAVRFLQRGGRLIAPLFWEFLPYNDAAKAPKVTPAFIAGALPLIDILKTQKSKRAKALKDLKALYGRHFGKSSEDRNLISLFLYSGPIGTRLRLGRGPLSGLPPQTFDFAQMHTGDGLLNDLARYRAFAKFYGGSGRLGRAKILQIMHHGALGAWHVGLAAKMAPQVAIFSSDPTHKGYGHPHKDVLRDFWTFGPMQVDRVNAYSVRRRLLF
jgi:hypothetical protein